MLQPVFINKMSLQNLTKLSEYEEETLVYQNLLRSEVLKNKQLKHIIVFKIDISVFVQFQVSMYE